MRAPTVTYIETDIIIYNLPDTDNPPLRTTAFRYLKRKSATLITHYELWITHYYSPATVSDI